MSHVETDATFFFHQVTIVSCDHCGWWPLLISHSISDLVEYDLTEADA